MDRQVLVARKATFILSALLMIMALLVGMGGFNAVGTSAQRSHPFCFSDELLSRSLRQNPALQRKMDEQERALRKSLEVRRNARKRQQSTTSKFIIPVVVYVVHNNGPENISDAQVNSQLDALNAAFNGQGVQFCLATKQGSTLFTGSTPGIIRIASGLTNHLTSQESQLKTLPPPLPLPPSLPGDRYLRIWVVKDIDNNSGVVGYARFPGTVPTQMEGIVMRHDVFGNALDTNCGCPNLLPSNNQGKILAHEVGHYLYLYHTFHGGCTGLLPANCATDGDMVCDTPQIAAANTGCPAPPASCSGAPALVTNHMDYTDDQCRTIFTTEQVGRMLATLNTLRPLLVSAQNLVYTGVQCAGVAIAAFSATNYNPCTGQTVTFTAPNSSGATYAWDFGDTTTSNVQNPTYAYTTAGTYTVTLIVTSGSNSVSSSEQVFVTACTPISSSQGNWYFGDKAGLNFSTGAPILDLNSSMSTTEGCVTQSDAAGALLFYSDSISVYDKNHSLMNPTTPLNGHQSNSQSSISIPDPSDPNPSDPKRFYLFTLGPGQMINASLWYTIVDLNTSPSGVLTNVNTQVSPTSGMQLTEQITAVPNCSNTGYWIIVHQNSPSKFVVYSLTAQSSGSSVIAGPNFHPALPGRLGSIKASPDGTMLAQSTFAWDSASGQWVPSAAVYDFDRATGAITLRKQLAHGGYGCSFSPDSKLLYVGEYPDIFISPQPPAEIYQYDLAVADPNNTVKLVAQIPTATNPINLQLGPDRKIYAATGDTTTGIGFLHVINYPNQRNTSANPNACGYNYNGPSLLPKHAKWGLPNMIDALPPAQIPADFSHTTSSCSTVQFYAPACATSYAWDFGDTTTSNVQNPTYAYAANGTYTVKLTLNSTSGTTTKIHTVAIGLLPASSATIYGPSGVCMSAGNPKLYNYSANAQPGLTYNWAVTGGTIVSVGNSDNIDVVWNTLPGTVQLTVNDPATGCSTTKTLTITHNCNPNQCIIPPAGMVNWWTFDETSGTTAQDLTGTFNNVGTHFNGPTPVAGIVDGALSFDGVDDYVEVANHQELNFGTCILDVAEPMTIDLWVKTNLPPTQQGANSGLRTILYKSAASQTSSYHLFLSNGRLGFQMNGSSYIAPATGPNYIDIADNQWHFVAVSLPMCRGFGGGFLYVDGQNVLSLPRGTGFTNTAKLYIGRHAPAFGTDFFQGVLDELEIFKSALSEDELRAIFEARSSGKCKVNCSGNPSPCRVLPARSTPRTRR